MTNPSATALRILEPWKICLAGSLMIMKLYMVNTYARNFDFNIIVDNL